jgi:hypothetical protein
MEALDEEIIALEAEIQEYRKQYNAATNSSDEARYGELIISARGTLNRLLDEKNRIGKQFQ